MIHGYYKLALMINIYMFTQGSYSLAGRSFCEACGPGTYTSDSTTKHACVDCEPGKYQKESSRTACEDCGTGSFQEYSGGINCSFCTNGTYNGQYTS